MKRVIGASLASLFLALLATPAAFAQDEPSDDSGKKVLYKQKTEIDFEDLSVDGELKKPHGQYVLDKRQAAFNPLIKMRQDFNPEMYESVNEVK